MPEKIIKINNLGKKYLIHNYTNERYSTLRDTISKNFSSFFPAIFKYLKNRGISRKPKEFWALSNINLEINKGDIVGVIGHNGAGKSTLLKILSRITEPTTGSFSLKGRVASLLEVGTGFHPELTGKENIFLNGSILGMSKKEIENRFSEIVEFSEIENFLDTPVKRYSSGMYVRLAFAIAAHLHPEILLVDEILSVGDAAFQNKCLGKMSLVPKEGRTIIFVSHNMSAISSLCNRAILLHRGNVTKVGDTSTVINYYLTSQIGKTYHNANGWYKVNNRVIEDQTSKSFRFTKIRLLNSDNQKENISTNDSILIKINYTASQQYISPAFVVILKDLLGVEILRLSTMPISGYQIETVYSKGLVELIINKLPLVAGRYILDIGFVRERIEWIIKLENVVEFDINSRDVYGSGFLIDRKRGIITANHQWLHKKCL